MNRTILLPTLALALAACSDSPHSPTAPSALRTRAERLSAPAPSPLVTVSLPQKTLQLWPFQGFGFGV